MALPTRTLDDVTRRILGYFRTSFPGFPLGTKKFLGRIARAEALTYWSLQKAVEDIDADIVPSPQSSSDALSAWANLLGLPDGQGGYGKRLPTTASGGAANITGVKGTVFPSGLTATAQDGTAIKLSGLVTIPGVSPGFGVTGAKFVALTAGIVGDLPLGTVCTWDAPPIGADTAFTITSAFGGGLEVESNSAVYGRIISRTQTPPRGGVAEDIREWLEGVAGVVRVFVYPKRSGLGTVDAVIVGGGTGLGRIPSAPVQAAAQATLDAKVSVGAQADTALLPNMPTANGLSVVVRVAPSAKKYEFDWDDRGATYTVLAASPGPPATITLNTMAAASLKAAVDAFIATSGLAPRIQLMSTGAVLGQVIGVIAYADAAGHTTLTLETLPDGFVAPTVGDAVFAYGPIVETVAVGSLALCDSLGPSRASGYADALTPWNDKLTISGLTAVAEDAIDSDGTELIAEVSPGGITINGVALDAQGGDGPLGPELLFLSHIAVVRAS
ncbi:MAG: baseplate J/gp47 family protein [Polyangia bacterium]